MPTLLFIFVTVLWGTSFIFIKIALQELSPLAFMFFRFLIATVSLVPLLLYEQSKIKRQDLLKGAQLGGLLGTLMFFQTIALQTLNASAGAFLLGFTPVFVLMLRFFVQKKTPNWLDIGATLVCVAGLGLVTQSHGITWQLGVLYMLLSSFFVALYIYAMEAYAGDSSVAVLTLVQMLVLSLLTGVIALVAEGQLPIPIQSSTWAALMACGVLCTSLAFGIQAYAQRYLSAFKLSMLTSLEPVFATIFAYWFLGEVLYPSFYLGAMLILGAIGVINWRLKELEV